MRVVSGILGSELQSRTKNDLVIDAPGLWLVVQSVQHNIDSTAESSTQGEELLSCSVSLALHDRPYTACDSV